jgi:hypothetical protein
MASATVASWTNGIKELQQCVFSQSTGPGFEKQVERMEREVQSLQKTFHDACLPSAAWNKLVRDVQVLACLQDGGKLPLGMIGWRCTCICMFSVVLTIEYQCIPDMKLKLHVCGTCHT